jgi:hypothetical protein
MRRLGSPKSLVTSLLHPRPVRPRFVTAKLYSLSYSVPENSPIRKFDEITVMVLPDIEHEFVAPKIAVEQFQLFPR